MFLNPAQTFRNVKTQLQLAVHHQLLAEAMPAVVGAHIRYGKSNAVVVLASDAVRSGLTGGAVFLVNEIILDTIAILSFL